VVHLSTDQGTRPGPAGVAGLWAWRHDHRWHRPERSAVHPVFGDGELLSGELLGQPQDRKPELVFIVVGLFMTGNAPGIW